MSSWKHALGGVASLRACGFASAPSFRCGKPRRPRRHGASARRTDLSASSFTVIRRAAFPITAIRETIGGSTAPIRRRMTDMPAACRTSITRRKPTGAVGQ